MAVDQQRPAEFCMRRVEQRLQCFVIGPVKRLDAQSRVIFEPDDLRLRRHWETPAQRVERENDYGAPLPPRKGEWGGAA